MRAAVLVDTGKLEIRDAPMPQLEPYQVLVRTTGVGICGTDLHIYGGSANYNRDACGRPISLRVMIRGGGPAGILFLQCRRNVYRFDGAVLVADINARKLALAESFGATVLQCTGEELVEVTLQRTHGEKVYYLVEATGTGAVFHFLPGLLRKQATVVLYGHGHEGADMTLLNYLQFLE